MPQSYDFIFKPTRDFREKFRKKLEIVECGMWSVEWSICLDEQVTYN